MLLTEPQIFQHLENHPDWSFEGGQLVANYEFSDFLESLGFVNDCAEVFEEVNHHAIVIINFNQVTLMLWTEDLEGITEADFALLTEIDRMVE